MEYLELTPLQIQRNEETRRIVRRRLAAEHEARLKGALSRWVQLEKERVSA